MHTKLQKKATDLFSTQYLKLRVKKKPKKLNLFTYLGNVFCQKSSFCWMLCFLLLVFILFKVKVITTYYKLNHFLFIQLSNSLLISGICDL